MNTNSQNSSKPKQISGTLDDADEIDLMDIVSFLMDHWLKLLMGALAGLFIAILWWYYFAPYKAEVILNNQNNLNYLTWQKISQVFPNLAAEMLQKKDVDNDQSIIFEIMKSPNWGKNVKPTFSLSKANTKDLPFISKEIQESAGMEIVNLVINAEGKTETDAKKSAEQIASFVKKGGAYISVDQYLMNLEQNILNQQSTIEETINKNHIELNYKNIQVAKLEQLRSQYPQNTTGINQQVVDPKDTGAKYLPINTQIVAVKAEIILLQELLERSNGQKFATSIIEEFLAIASKRAENQYDGISLITDLLNIEESLRNKVDGNRYQLDALNNIKATLTNIKAQFTIGLKSSIGAKTSKIGVLLPCAIGAIIGFIFILMFILIFRIKQKLTDRQKSAA